MSTYDSTELDDILSDVRRLLNEDEPSSSRTAPVQKTPGQETVRRAAPSAASPVSDETRMYTPVHQRPEQPVQPHQQPAAEGTLPWEDPDFAGTYYGPNAGGAPVVRSASVHARSGGAAAPRQQAAAAPRQQAAQAPRQQTPSARQTQPAESRSSNPKTRREQTQAEVRVSGRRRYQEEDEFEEMDDELEEELPRKKKRHRLLKLVIVLLVILAALAGLTRLIAKQPVLEGEHALGDRKSGVSTILLIGTDAGGTRTDTMMLMKLDNKEHTISLVSIPRDTLVNGSYSVPKLNGVYGINGGGEEGMEMLLQRVSECIGFYPDGYVMVNLDGFVDLVDIMGGITFDVPQDMYYNDPSQDLYIDLKAGEQKLNGTEAMGLVRFRSGYAQADLARVEVQRDFVSTAVDQWMGPKLLFKAPQLIAWLKTNVETDMSLRNMFWLAWAMFGADTDSMTTETLPGSAANINGGSYYVLSPYDVVNTVNESLNPYERDITVDDLYIRG